MPTFDRLETIVKDARRVFSSFYHDEPDILAECLKNLDGCTTSLATLKKNKRDIEGFSKAMAGRLAEMDMSEATLKDIDLKIKERSDSNAWDKSEIENTKRLCEDALKDMKKNREHVVRMQETHLVAKAEAERLHDTLRFGICDELVGMTMDCVSHYCQRNGVIIHVVE